MARFESLKGRALFFISLAWLLWFMNFMSRTIFAPILPLLEDEFGVTHAQAAAIFTSISLGYGLSLFFSGVYARFLGFRRSVAVSIAASSIPFSLVSFVRVFELFYVLGFVLGLAVGMYLPSMLSLITDYYHEKMWGSVIAIHDSGASVSTTAAPFVALLILSFLPWRGIFILLGIASALCAILFYLNSQEVPMVKGRNYFLGALWKKRSLCIMGTLFIFAGGTSLGLYVIIPLYLVKELSLDVSYANTIFGISRIGAAIAAISAGFFVDRFSLKKTLFSIVCASGLLTFALGLCSVAWLKVILFLQAGAIIGFFPVAFVAISRIFDRESRGQAIGFVATLNVVFGSGVVPYLLGLSGDLVGFRFGICLIGILTTLSSGLLYFLRELR
jgi:NNP family nitrate/nitrite transporter-like MFS transporter